MAKAGILLETDNGKIKPSNYGVITAARGDGEKEGIGFLLDASAAECKDAVQAYGMNRIVEVSAGAGDISELPELKAKTMAEAMQQYGISALFSVSSTGARDLMARVAADLDLPLVLDCIGVDFKTQVATKSHFSGKTVAKIQLNGDAFICGIRPNTIEPVSAPVEAEVETFSAAAEDSGRLKIVEIKGAVNHLKSGH